MTAEVMDVYADAIELPQPQTRLARAAVRSGLAPIEPGPRVPPRKLASIEPVDPEAPGARGRAPRAGSPWARGRCSASA